MIYTEEQIQELVMMKYPKLEKEKTCYMEKTFRDLARQDYRNKLINESKAEKAILVEHDADSA